MPGGRSRDDYLGGSIQRVDLQTGKVETVVTKCGEHPLRGPNDLVFDRHGGLWFSDLGKRRARDIDVGAFYYLKPGMKEIVEGVYRHAAGQRHRTLARREHRLRRGDADGAAVGLSICRSPARSSRAT